MMLYHGSNMDFEKIDLGKCRPFKDFGKGFYTSPIQEQAWLMARRTVRIYRKGKPFVIEYFLDDAFLSDADLKIKRFNGPCNEWARFVVKNRNHQFQDRESPECNVDGKYDIVIGPVANDDIAALINVYLAGIISEEALTKELTFRDLSMQTSFHTEKAVTCLRQTGIYYE
jgi:hypothetical protein